MPPFLDIDERRALASPWDWAEDFDRPTYRGACSNCLRVFVGLPSRTLCRRCAKGESHET